MPTVQLPIIMHINYGSAVMAYCKIMHDCSHFVVYEEIKHLHAFECVTYLLAGRSKQKPVYSFQVSYQLRPLR